jgi:hypothetical protein
MEITWSTYHQNKQLNSQKANKQESQLCNYLSPNASPVSYVEFNKRF